MKIVQIGPFPKDAKYIGGGVEASVYGLSVELAETNSLFIVDVPRHEIKKDYSEKTVKAYSDWISKLGDFYNKNDFDKIGFKEISQYLIHLNERLGIAPSTINQAFQSYNYLFNTILEKNIDFSKISKPERKRSNPDILTPEEILSIIENTDNLQHKLLIATAYSAGLELSETKNLKISDIDNHRDLIKIRDTKGKIKGIGCCLKIERFHEGQNFCPH